MRVISQLGLTKAEWAPDGRTVLCFSEWGVRPPPIEIRTHNPHYFS